MRQLTILIYVYMYMSSLYVFIYVHVYVRVDHCLLVVNALNICVLQDTQSPLPTQKRTLLSL